MAGILQKHFQADTSVIGIHIRTNSMSADDSASMPADMYTTFFKCGEMVEKIEGAVRHPDKVSFFLAADKADLRPIADKWFGSRVFRHNGSIGRSRGDELHAVVDLFLLSFAEQLIIFPGSTYAMHAHAYSAIRPFNVLRKDLCVQYLHTEPVNHRWPNLFKAKCFKEEMNNWRSLNSANVWFRQFRSYYGKGKNEWKT